MGIHIDREGSQVTGDSEYEDEDTTFFKNYGKKEAGASDSFFVLSLGKSLEIWNPWLKIFRCSRRQWRRLWM
jgi:hypothetical protein